MKLLIPVETIRPVVIATELRPPAETADHPFHHPSPTLTETLPPLTSPQTLSTVERVGLVIGFNVLCRDYQ